jgi:hypothetical protein
MRIGGHLTPGPKRGAFVIQSVYTAFGRNGTWPRISEIDNDEKIIRIISARAAEQALD